MSKVHLASYTYWKFGEEPHGSKPAILGTGLVIMLTISGPAWNTQITVTELSGFFQGSLTSQGIQGYANLK